MVTPQSTISSDRPKRRRPVQPWPPTHLTPVPAKDLTRPDPMRKHQGRPVTTAQDAITFMQGSMNGPTPEGFCRVTKDSIAAPAGQVIALYPWQQKLISHLYARRADGKLRHRQGLIGVARKNGKSALGAGLGLHGLVTGPAGGEVYSCAADKAQARIVHDTARRMVEMDDRLSRRLNVYRDVIERPDTGSVWRVLSAEAYTKEGLNPHLVIFDEVHAQPNRELWDVMALAMGARPEPLLVGITTAGVRTDSTGQDSLGYYLYQYGKQVAAKEIDDPTFFMAWWEPRDPEADHRDVSTLREANPGYGVLVSEEDFASAVRRTREPEYRTKRCNQWVTSSVGWLPHGAWKACEDPRPIEPYSDVILGFDGSFSNDSTALIAVELGDTPHIDVVECWEKPAAADDTWRVPVGDVEEAIRTACRQYQVRDIVCDPFRWARTYQALEEEGLPVLEFPQSPQRMVPATQRFYEAVLNRGLTHSGDPRLARHIDNCTLRVDSRGARLAKDAKNSPRKIDLAVSAVMAFTQAFVAPEPAAATPSFAFIDL